jgi:hypothetical protein
MTKVEIDTFLVAILTPTAGDDLNQSRGMLKLILIYFWCPSRT